MTLLSVPTTAALSSAQTIPSSHPAVVKILGRLSRPSLLSLALDWLDERNQDITAPYLVAEDEVLDDDDDQDVYPPASSLSALRESYTELQAGKSTRRDVVDRIIEGDWRDGISLYQLAMADMQYLYDHPSSQKWTALKIVPLSSITPAPKNPSIPRFHPATFLRNMQREGLPDVKTHYNLDRHPNLPLLILRVFVLESPYNTARALQPISEQKIFDSSRTFYVAFPDASPYVYISLVASPSIAHMSSGPKIATADNKSLRNILLEGIPKAFSRPRERYKLESTSLGCKNLDAMIEKRGGGRTNAAGGGWEVYAKGESQQRNPLEIQLPMSDPSAPENEEPGEERGLGMKRKRTEDDAVVTRRRLVAKGRFGSSAKVDDGKGIERLDIRIGDRFPFANQGDHDSDAEADNHQPQSRKRKGRRSDISLELDKYPDEVPEDSEWRPDVKITFHGHNVFAGVRQLVEAGIVDGEKMPGWMTGEEGITVGVVKDGRVRGFRGSGM